MSLQDRKTICFLISNLNNAGGTERVCSLIANGLAKIGYKVIITSISEGTSPFYPLHSSIKVTTLFPLPGRYLYRTPIISYRIRKLLKRYEIDTLISVESMSILFSLPAIQGLDIKHICWEHFNFKSDLGKPARRVARQLAAHFCDAIVTLTERDRSYWLNGTFHKSQIIAIENPSPFPPQEIIQKDSNKTVISVGRLTHQKGFDNLLKAWVKVIKTNPEWRLIIVGEGKDKQNLANFIHEHDLSNSVSLVGNTTNISEFYRKADIYCLSSRYEGFPMVLLEALSFSLPVVSFDCDTGPAEILNDTGSLLVSPNNNEKLASALIELMNDDDKRAEIAVKSFKKSYMYQPKNIIEKWIKLIEE